MTAGGRGQADRLGWQGQAVKPGPLDYLRSIPARDEIPARRVIVHNRVLRPSDEEIAELQAEWGEDELGLRGFRAWLADASAPGGEPCGCGWRPELGAHYRAP